MNTKRKMRNAIAALGAAVAVVLTAFPAHAVGELSGTGGVMRDAERRAMAPAPEKDNAEFKFWATIDGAQTNAFVFETTEIKTGPAAGYGGPKSTARNQKAIGMALTVAISTKDYPWKGGKEGKEVLGSRQLLTTFKSKLAPRNRTITLFRKSLGGYDMAETDLQFFLGDPKNNNCAQNPFLPGGFLFPEGWWKGAPIYAMGGEDLLMGDPEAYVHQPRIKRAVGDQHDLFALMEPLPQPCQPLLCPRQPFLRQFEDGYGIIRGMAPLSHVSPSAGTAMGNSRATSRMGRAGSSLPVPHSQKSLQTSTCLAPLSG